MINRPLLITIDSQPGSGGDNLGQRIAKRLNFKYVDNETLKRDAQTLKLQVRDYSIIFDEQPVSIWKSLTHSFLDYYGLPVAPQFFFIPKGEALRAIMSNLITKSCSTNSVIVKNGSGYILHDYSNHFGILLHGSAAYRKFQIKRQFQVSDEQADILIKDSDYKHMKYLQIMTVRNWQDAELYHLSIDTSLVNIETAENLVLSALHLNS